MNVLDLPVGSRRYLDIARKLAGDIESGRYFVGERLPPERELAQKLDVSRTTVREALLALEIMRFIEIRVGSGVFVLDQSQRAQSDFVEPDGAPPSDVLAARRIIEGETAALAARNATTADLNKMQATIDEMAASIHDIARFDVADAAFHTAISKAAANDVLAGFVAHLWRMREGNMWTRWYDQTRHASNREKSVEHHKIILRAIERRAPEVARTAMQTHLDGLAERFYQLKL
ncbi:MAG: FadR/GntR family transcriptional regulator [Paracoccaceae bacterium]